MLAPGTFGVNDESQRHRDGAKPMKRWFFSHTSEKSGYRALLQMRRH
jgi:hypothetical protein